jgi:hypothetical protein
LNWKGKGGVFAFRRTKQKFVVSKGISGSAKAEHPRKAFPDLAGLAKAGLRSNFVILERR